MSGTAPEMLILCGPSCVGKDPLLAALRRVHPELPFAQPIVHASRRPRPGERDGVDFWFRSADAIRAYDPACFFVYPLRDQWRAIDWQDVDDKLAADGRLVVQLSPLVVAPFRAHLRLAARRVTALLLQPLSVAEALAMAAHNGRSPEDVVGELMLAKQVQRAHALGQALDPATLADLRTRAAATWAEMQPRPGFDHVLVNHDAEGSPHWACTPPPGDAGATVAALARLLAGDI
jgi:hypothetical protein